MAFVPSATSFDVVLEVGEISLGGSEVSWYACLGGHRLGLSVIKCDIIRYESKVT